VRLGARLSLRAPLSGAFGRVLLAYGLVRLGNGHLTAVASGDSSIYMAMAGLAPWDPDFYAGRYPWATPLLWKFLPGSHLPALGQLALSTVAWGVLAVTGARLLAPGRRQLVALISILAFSLVGPVTVWDRMLLSESLSISLFALLLSAWLTLVRHVSWRTVGLVLALTLLWSFTRDSNAYVAAMTVPLLGVWLMRSSRRRFPAAILAGTCAIFALSVASADKSQRHEVSLNNVFNARFVGDPEARSYFVAHGMPLGGPAYRRWLREEGDDLYLRYLVSHPGYAIGAPLGDIVSWLSPTDFRVGPPRRLLPVPVEELLYPPETFQLWFWLVVAAVGGLVTAGRLGARRIWVIPLVTVATAIGQGMVVWLGDTEDLDRHLVLTAIQIRLGLLLLVLFIADRVLTGLERDRERSGGTELGRADDRTPVVAG
jgi:hypothetical protein